MHSRIRRRTRQIADHAQPYVGLQARVNHGALTAAEARYLAGETLRDVAPDIGISRLRLASLLRDRGVRLRRSSPTPAEVDEMIRRYAASESLERVGSRLRFSASTVRSKPLSAGIVLRDSHGRERQPQLNGCLKSAHSWRLALNRRAAQRFRKTSPC